MSCATHAFHLPWCALGVRFGDGVTTVVMACWSRPYLLSHRPCKLQPTSQYVRTRVAGRWTVLSATRASVWPVAILRPSETHSPHQARFSPQAWTLHTLRSARLNSSSVRHVPSLPSGRTLAGFRSLRCSHCRRSDDPLWDHRPRYISHDSIS